MAEPDPSAASRAAARTAALFASVAAALLVSQQVAGKATRDALFLSTHPTSSLPTVMVGAAILALVVVLCVSRLLARWSPRRVAPLFMVVNAALFAGEWWLVHDHLELASTVVYLHTAAVGAAVISSFWSLVTERFDPHTARQVIGRVAAGATAGGVAGGVAAWQLSDRVDLRGMLLVLVGVNLVAAAVTALISGAEPTGDDDDADAPGAVAILRRTPYLRLLAALVFLAALGDSAVDYVFKSSAADRFGSSASLVTFFGLFHAGVGVATFALQTMAVRRSLDRIGLAGTMAFLPGAVMVTGAAALAAPILATAGLLRGASSALENSLYRSGYELLYTPLPPASKRPTKTLIDVGCDKLGAALGSGLAMLAVLAPDHVTRFVLLAGALGAAVLTLAITRSLHAGYVAALADSLRNNTISLDEHAVHDATTRRTLADTTALNRDVLLAEIAALRARQDGGDPEAEATDPDRLMNCIAGLRSDDPTTIKQTLRRASPLAPELIGHVIPLLERDDVLAPVLTALRQAAPRATGQLVDALLDPSSPVRVRRRLPRVLRNCHSQRSVDGLLLGLRDEVFEVRYRCATALSRIAVQHDQTRIDHAQILAAASTALDHGAGELDDSDEPTPFEAEAQLRQQDHTLTYIVTLLSSILDREPLLLAFSALSSTDDRLHGTGREYLENVLPPEVRGRLEPLLGDRGLARRQARSRDEVVDELLASRDSLTIDLADLRRSE